MIALAVLLCSIPLQNDSLKEQRKLYLDADFSVNSIDILDSRLLLNGRYRAPSLMVGIHSKKHSLMSAEYWFASQYSNSPRLVNQAILNGFSFSFHIPIFTTKNIEAKVGAKNFFLFLKEREVLSNTLDVNSFLGGLSISSLNHFYSKNRKIEVIQGVDYSLIELGNQTPYNPYYARNNTEIAFQPTSRLTNLTMSILYNFDRKTSVGLKSSFTKIELQSTEYTMIGAGVVVKYTIK